MPNSRSRTMTIRQKRKARAKKKVAEGFQRSVERENGGKKIRFVKPSAA